MKIISPDILHKSDCGGVALNVGNDAQVNFEFGQLLNNARGQVPKARIDGVLVARQVKGAVECIMGIQRDAVFGSVALFGSEVYS
jgi:acetate---CoA ligase (ADP-forming)